MEMLSNLDYNRYLSLFGYGNENQQALYSNSLQNHSKIILEDTKICAIYYKDTPISEKVYHFLRGWNQKNTE